MSQMERSGEEGGNTKTPSIDSNDNQRAQRVKWCMTLHNMEIGAMEREICSDIFSKFVFSEEMGKSGNTPHIQGAFILKKRKRMSELKKVFGNKVHLEAMRGTWKEAYEYCMKENGKKWTSEEHIWKRDYEGLWDKQKAIVNLFEADCGFEDRKIYWFYETRRS